MIYKGTSQGVVTLHLIGFYASLHILFSIPLTPLVPRVKLWMPPNEQHAFRRAAVCSLEIC